VVATSDSAPSTSPVMPPRRRTACRSSMNAAASPSAMASGSVHPISFHVTTAALAAASATRVSSAGIRGRTVPATMAPSPPGRAAGTPRRHVQVMVNRPVTTAAITAAAPRTAPPVPEACASAATWMSTASRSVTTPSGPMSDFRMTSSAAVAGLPLPRPSARSASPSRCRPRVSSASTATATAAPVSGPAPSGWSTTVSRPAAMTPSSAPTPGAHAIAAPALARSGGAGSRRPGTGMTVSNVTASARPFLPTANEPTGDLPKDVLSQRANRPNPMNATSMAS
jgi:hypothetical protein